MSRVCLDCPTSLEGAHSNRVRCGSCAQARLSCPKHTLDAWQQGEVRRLLANTSLKRAAIADRVGCSLISVQRFLSQSGLSAAKRLYSQETIDAVVAYYNENGKNGIADAFPGVAWRSIVERVSTQTRLRKWQPHEVVMAAKMAGLVPLDVQAAVFARPNARAGSIRSFWLKRMGQCGSRVHGMSYNQARLFLRPGFPRLYTRFYFQRPRDKKTQPLILWCEMLPYLRDDMPSFFRDAIAAMHEFQCWLYQTDDPASVIRAMAALGQRPTS